MEKLLIHGSVASPPTLTHAHDSLRRESFKFPPYNLKVLHKPVGTLSKEIPHLCWNLELLQELHPPHPSELGLNFLMHWEPTSIHQGMYNLYGWDGIKSNNFLHKAFKVTSTCFANCAYSSTFQTWKRYSFLNLLLIYWCSSVERQSYSKIQH